MISEPSSNAVARATAISNKSFVISSQDDLTLFAELDAKNKRLVRRRLQAMKVIFQSDSVWAGCQKASSAERGWSAKTLHALYAAFCQSEGDWTVLVDRAIAGPRWQNLLERSGLPQAFQDHLGSIYARNQRAKFAPAYAALIAQYRRWLTGDPTAHIPGYDICPEPDPESREEIPSGWSYTNLLRAAQRNADDFSRKLVQLGPKASSQLGPQILTTRVGRPVGSYWFLDDSWNDFRCAAFRQTCRLLSFHALDYPSGCNVTRGHKPAIRDEETQVEQRLREKEIVWLVVKLLTNEGFHRDGCIIACEKATATLRKREREILAATMGDTIVVQDGPSGGGPGIPALFSGPGGGNPRWKAPLESWFNLLRNRTADLLEFPGQTGSNSRINLPEGLAGTEADVKALFKAAQVLAPDQVEKLRLGLLPFTEAIFRVDAIVEIINRRTDHNLEGWKESGRYIEEFRTNLLRWTPADLLLEYNLEERDQAAAYLAHHPECRRTRPLSPREVFELGRKDLVKLPMPVAALLLDETPGTEATVRNNQLEIGIPDLDPSEPRFFGFERRDGQGAAEPLRNGDKWMVRVNPLDPRVAWLYTATGKWSGVVDYYGRVARTDTKSLQEAFARKRKALAPLISDARRLAASVTQDAIDRSSANHQVFSSPASAAKEHARALRNFDGADLEALAETSAPAAPAEDDNQFSPESLL